jgi:ribonuclease kappa
MNNKKNFSFFLTFRFLLFLYSKVTMVRWPICGPKLSFCCSIISVWGIIQFLLMGIFFFMEAAPLLDDFQLEYDTTNEQAFKDNLQNAYSQRAYNCWIAAFLYVGLLVFAGSQFMSNQKGYSGTNLPTSTSLPFSGVTTEENGFNRQYGIQFNADQNDS